MLFFACQFNLRDFCNHYNCLNIDRIIWTTTLLTHWVNQVWTSKVIIFYEHYLSNAVSASILLKKYSYILKIFTRGSNEQFFFPNRRRGLKTFIGHFNHFHLISKCQYNLLMQRFKLKYEPVSIREYSANLRTRKKEIAIFKHPIFFQNESYRSAATQLLIMSIYFVSSGHFFIPMRLSLK